MLSTILLAVSIAVGPTPVAVQCPTGSVARSQECVRLGVATDPEVRAYLVAQSIRSYSGSCPCPSSTDRAGRRCGGRSAYSRAGGASVFCSPSDVSDEAVAAARARYPAP